MLRRDGVLDVHRPADLAVLRQPVCLPAADLLVDFGQRHDRLVKLEGRIFRLRRRVLHFSQPAGIDRVHRGARTLHLRGGRRLLLLAILLPGADVGQEAVENLTEFFDLLVGDFLPRALILCIGHLALGDCLHDGLDRVPDLFANPGIVREPPRHVVVLRARAGVKDLIAARVGDLLRFRGPVLTRKIVIDRVHPLVSERAGALDLGQVDHAVVALIVRPSPGQTLPARAEGQRQFAVQGDRLWRQSGDLGQIEERIIALVQDVLALGIVVPVAELHAAEAEHVHEVLPGHVPALGAAVFAQPDRFFQRRVNAVVDPGFRFDYFDCVLGHVEHRFVAALEPVLDRDALPVADRADDLERAILAAGHAMVARDLGQRNEPLRFLATVEQLGPVAVADRAVRLGVEDHEFLLVGLACPQVPILDH